MVRCRAAVRRAATRKNTTLLFVSRSHWERDAVPLSGTANEWRDRDHATGATETATGATGAFSKRRLGFTHGRLGPLGATRGTDRLACRLARYSLGARHGRQLARRGDWATGKAPRWGVGDDSQRRVARAGSHSAERVGARHYRARRHFLCGPFLGFEPACSQVTHEP